MAKKIKRKISAKGRKKLRKNAMKGVRKWERMSHKKRVAARKAKPHNWGFEGKSPRTRPRKYKGTR
jgi:hypothetical protein